MFNIFEAKALIFHSLIHLKTYYQGRSLQTAPLLRSETILSDYLKRIRSLEELGRASAYWDHFTTGIKALLCS